VTERRRRRRRREELIRTQLLFVTLFSELATGKKKVFNEKRVISAYNT
jgi:hypothetical protein